jgi:ADP-dependent phosphofructokinase/glucokinase
MKILCGYNVNIDSVYRISGTEVSELLKAYERPEILEKIQNPPGKIRSEADFIAGLVSCMTNGSGAEWLVLEQAVFEFLKSRYFEKSLIRMGGNAGIMANALSQLGASKVIPNIAAPSNTQLSLFSKKAIYFPKVAENGFESELKTETTSSPEDRSSTEDGLKNELKENLKEKDLRNENSALESEKQPNFSSQNKESKESLQDPIHFVFDFSKEDTFSLYGTEVKVPRENRFIATCDRLNFKLFVNPAFEKYALEHIQEIDGALISGFHLLLENYAYGDGSGYETILEKTLTQLRNWKAKNEKLQLHIEFGHFSSKKLANSVLQKFAGISDSIGMNEDELSMFQETHRVPREQILQMNIEQLGSAALRLALNYKLKKLLIHTREFILTVFKPDFCQNLESDVKLGTDSGLNNKKLDFQEPDLQNIAGKKLEAMEFGIKCAGMYAASGRIEYGNLAAIGNLELKESDFGKKQLELFLKAFNGKISGKGAYALKEKHLLCMMPTLLSSSPITTVGLGDTLTAGIFLRGLELDVQAQA